MLQSLTIAGTMSDEVPTLELVGSLDVHTHRVLRHQLESLIEEGDLHIRLDLTKVDYLGSIGLGVLIHANKQLKALGGKLTVVPGKLRRHLELMQLHRVFDLE